MIIRNSNKNFLIIYIIGLITFVWVSIFVYLFFFVTDITNFTWTRGEIGDFIGGGLGGTAVFLLIYTSWIQLKHLKNQEKDLKEASIFRTFQALKPEAENITARIVSKIIKEKLVNDTQKDFDEMLRKFRNGDRTVFLRTILKEKYNRIVIKNDNPLEVSKSCARFKNLINVVYNEIKDRPEDDFSKAILATEVFQVFRVFQK